MPARFYQLNCKITLLPDFVLLRLRKHIFTILEPKVVLGKKLIWSDFFFKYCNTLKNFSIFFKETPDNDNKEKTKRDFINGILFLGLQDDKK